VSEKSCKVVGTDAPVDASQDVRKAYSEPEMLIVVHKASDSARLRTSLISQPDAEVVVDERCPRNYAWTMSREAYEAWSS
jgi:hypothetical protein